MKYIRGGKEQEVTTILKIHVAWLQAWCKISLHSDVFLSLNAQILFSTINVNVHGEGAVNALEPFFFFN